MSLVILQRSRRQRSRWHHHPAVISGDELTLGERAADRMRNAMGSWWFVIGALAFLASWMSDNRHRGFDPYPFILLNLVLSCVAALQGAILLIAAKRSDHIASQLAQHDFETDTRAAERIEELHDQVAHLHATTALLLDQQRALLDRVGADRG